MPNLAPQGQQDFNTGSGRSRAPRVELVLEGERVLLAERYQVKLAFLTQPAAFSLTLGTGDDLAKLIADTLPNDKFQLRINGRTVMTGYLDGVSSRGTTGVLTVEGRDALAPLHDACLLQEQSFKDDTYAQLVRKVMDGSGLKDTKLVFSNRANRLAIAGRASQRKDPRSVEALRLSGGAGGGVKKHVQAQLGEKGYEFCKRHLDRGGLFLWAGADGQFILSEPNPDQAPLYRLHRSAGSAPEFSTEIIDHAFENRTAGRFSEIHVYTRGETKKAGRSKTVEVVKDTEMLSWGFNRPMVLRDVDADTPQKAAFMGRRKMAESRRAGWKLSYTVAGHVTGSPIQGAGLVTWAPDTLCEVEDRRLGIDDTFWIEAVTFAGAPQATTQIELMRVQDLIFGEGQKT